MASELRPGCPAIKDTNLPSYGLLMISLSCRVVRLALLSAFGWWLSSWCCIRSFGCSPSFGVMLYHPHVWSDGPVSRHFDMHRRPPPPPPPPHPPLLPVTRLKPSMVVCRQLKKKEFHQVLYRPPQDNCLCKVSVPHAACNHWHRVPNCTA